MPGPYAEGFLTENSIQMLYNTTWTISHNAARGGIRLVGPRPKWEREDGGEGGSHPSNVIEYGYPVGALNWTGDDPVLFPVDAPDFGGFVSSTTIVKADFWRLGQMKAGNKLRLRPVSYTSAITKRQEVEHFVSKIAKCCKGEANFEDVQALVSEETFREESVNGAILHSIDESGNQPLVSYRQGGDDFILVDYGHGSFNLNYRCRAVALYRKLKELKGQVSFAAGTLHTGMACGNSLMIYFDALAVGREKMMECLLKLETELGDLSQSKFPSRKYRLPITFESQKQKDNPAEFVAKNNAFSIQQLRDIFTKSTLMVVAVGFFVALPIALPIDPRQRIQSPKMNPSRVHTPEGQVGWGGSCMALYNVESPGGYMNIGLSIPGADILGYKDAYNEDKPWLFEDFDQITFYEVSEEEYNRQLAIFYSGRYKNEYEDTVFDLRQHNVLLEETAEEVKMIRKEQRRAQKEMDNLEKELLAKWITEKDSVKPSLDTIERLLQDPSIVSIEAPLNANVWKVEVEEGDKIKGLQSLAILEAMKLEVPVKADENHQGFVVEKLIAKPGEVVEAGKPLVLLKKT